MHACACVCAPVCVPVRACLCCVCVRASVCACGSWQSPTLTESKVFLSMSATVVCLSACLCVRACVRLCVRVEVGNPPTLTESKVFLSMSATVEWVPSLVSSSGESGCSRSGDFSFSSFFSFTTFFFSFLSFFCCWQKKEMYFKGINIVQEVNFSYFYQ